MNEQNAEVADESIGGARQGQREAFERLVMLHREDLQEFIAARVANPEDAADISQQVLLQAFVNLGSFDGRAAPSTWLLSIARRTIADFYRAHRNSTYSLAGQSAFRREDPDDLSSTAGGSIPGMCDARHQVEGCVACVLKALPLHEQMAIILCDVYGFSDSESSRLLGDNFGALKHLLHRARATMDLISGTACALVRKSGTPSCCGPAAAGGSTSPALSTQNETRSMHMEESDSRRQALLSLRADLLRDIETLLHP